MRLAAFFRSVGKIVLKCASTALAAQNNANPGRVYGAWFLERGVNLIRKIKVQAATLDCTAPTFEEDQMYFPERE